MLTIARTRTAKARKTSGKNRTSPKEGANPTATLFTLAISRPSIKTT
jgi:hypothetical protein